MKGSNCPPLIEASTKTSKGMAPNLLSSALIGNHGWVQTSPKCTQPSLWLNFLAWLSALFSELEPQESVKLSSNAPSKHRRS
jgi:hypothetical protein